MKRFVLAAAALVSAAGAAAQSDLTAEECLSLAFDYSLERELSKHGLPDASADVDAADVEACIAKGWWAHVEMESKTTPRAFLVSMMKFQLDMAEAKLRRLEACYGVPSTLD